MKRESTKVPWKLSLAKKYDPAPQRTLHQNRWHLTCYFTLLLLLLSNEPSIYWHIWSFLPQFIYIFTFWFLIFDVFSMFYGVHQVPLHLFYRLVKFSASKCFYYVLISMKHSFLLTAKIASDVDNSLFFVQVVYICQVTFL